MFSRIRHAAHVLSYSPPRLEPRDQPDIVFEELDRPQVGRISKVIGFFIELTLVSAGIGIVAGPMIYKLFPAKPTASLVTITGFAASLMAFLGQRFLHDINNRIRLHLKIGERISPYFGHKITRAVQILRG